MRKAVTISTTRCALTEPQQVRALMMEYARWNWLFLVISYGNVLLIVFVGGAVRNAGPWIGALSMLTIGISGMMQDLTTRRRLSTVLGLGVPSRVVARAMWHESILLPTLAFSCASAISAMVWGLGLSGNTLPLRLAAIVPNSLVAAASCSVMVHAATTLGPPTSTALRDLVRNGGGGIKYIAAVLISAVGGGYLCFVNHEVIVRSDGIQLPWLVVTLLLACETLVAIALLVTARGAAHRLLVRRVRVRKGVVVAASSCGQAQKQKFDGRRPTYLDLVRSEAMRHALQALSVPALGMLLIGLFLTVGGYNAMEADILVVIISWLPIMAVFWTVKQVARWLSGLTALRMLPWQTTRIAVFILAGPVLTGLFAALAALALSVSLGVPIQPAWLLLLIWVPLLGYLLSPRIGAGVLASALMLWALYGLGDMSNGPAALACGFVSLAVLAVAFLRTRLLVNSSTFHRQRRIAFLGDEEQS